MSEDAEAAARRLQAWFTPPYVNPQHKADLDLIIRTLTERDEHVDLLEELVDDLRGRVIELERVLETLQVELNRGASM
jgi:hypothetical protein